MEGGFQIEGGRAEDGFQTEGGRAEDGFQTEGGRAEDGFETEGGRAEDGFSGRGRSRKGRFSERGRSRGQFPEGQYQNAHACALPVDPQSLTHIQERQSLENKLDCHGMTDVILTENEDQCAFKTQILEVDWKASLKEASEHSPSSRNCQ